MIFIPRCLSVIIAITLFSGCMPDTLMEDEKKETWYFKTESYFQNQMDSLNKTSVELRKTVFLNEKEETKSVEAPSWEKELAPFLKADLNKPAWRDYVTCDTSFSGSRKTIVCTSNSEDVPVKKQKVVFEDGKVKEFEASISSENMLYTSQQELHYIPGKRYSVRGLQDVFLVSKNKFEVEGEFIP